MANFIIIAESTSTERHTATADSAAAALALFRNGETSLKDDEPSGYGEVTIINSDTGERITEEQLEALEAAATAPVLRTYPVLLQATASVRYETSVEAASEEDAIRLAREEHDGYEPPYEVATVNHDFTAHVYEPEDKSREGDGIEIDCRTVGEPFSWDAIFFVKRMAAFTTAEEDCRAALGRDVTQDEIAEYESDNDRISSDYAAFVNMIAEARKLLKQPEAPAQDSRSQEEIGAALRERFINNIPKTER